MLPCARSCTGKRIKLVPAACLELPSIGEPLLFLYPQQLQIAAQKRVFRSTPLSGRHRAAVQFRIDETELEQSFQDAPTTASSGHTKSWSKETSGPSLSYKKSVSGIGNAMKSSPVKSRQKPDRYTRRSSPLQQSEEAQPSLDDINKNKAMFNPRNIDAQGLMRTLIKLSQTCTPSPRKSAQSRMLLPRRFLERYLGTSGENMWLHRVISGCRVFVPESLDETSEHCEVRLEGSVRSCERTIQRLKTLVVEFVAQEAHDLNETAEKLDEDQEPHDRNQNLRLNTLKLLRVDDLPPPQRWTLQSFFTYVKAVTNTAPLRSIGRITYPHKESYDKVAAKILEDLFSSYDLQPFFSTIAFRHALHFLRQRTHLSTSAGRIWNCALEAGLVPDIHCVNLELKHCLTVNNLDRIEYLFSRMKYFNISPNMGTWCLIVNSMRSSMERRLALDSLTRYQPIKTAADREELGKALIRVKLDKSALREGEVESLETTIQNYLGNLWLSERLLVDIIDQCLSSKQFFVISNILSIANAHKVRLTERGITQLLGAVRRTNNLEDVLMLLKIESNVLDDLVRQDRLEIVFSIAWAQNMFNICRSIWQCAACSGGITFKMRKMVADSLAQHSVLNADPSFDGTKSTLAALTIGTDTQYDDFEQIYPLLSHYIEAQNPVEHLVHWVPNDGTRQEQLSLKRQLIERDLTAWMNFEPIAWSTALSMLDKAYKLDMKWKSRNLVKKTTFVELQRQAIKIELQPRSTKLPETKTELEEGLRIDDIASNQQSDVTVEGEIPLHNPTTQQNDTISSRKHHKATSQDSANQYKVFSDGSAPTFSPTYAVTPAMAITTSLGIFDLVFQHLILAWQSN